MNDSPNIKKDRYIQSGHTIPDLPVPFGWRGNEYPITTIGEAMAFVEDNGGFTHHDARGYKHPPSVLASQLRKLNYKIYYQHPQWVLHNER